MSVIGPGSLGAINLAGSVAGGVKTSAGETDRMKEAAGQRNTAADVKSLAAQSLEDIGQADQSAERDADGRMPLGDSNSESAMEPAEHEEDVPRRKGHKRFRPTDADGVRGRRLDLEA